MDLAQYCGLPGHQRPDRLRPSLPGAGRPVHAPGAGRPARRARRWPTSATATTWPAAWPIACGKLGMRFAIASPPGYEFDDGLSRSCSSANRRGLELLDHARSGRGRAQGRRRLHRRLDEHGPGGGGRARRQAFAAYQVNAAADGQGPQGRLLHALPAGPPRRGSDRRRDRRPAERRRRSRPPTACTCRRGCWRGC